MFFNLTNVYFDGCPISHVCLRAHLGGADGAGPGAGVVRRPWAGVVAGPRPRVHQLRARTPRAGRQEVPRQLLHI